MILIEKHAVRLLECLECLKKNAENHKFERVVVLFEGGADDVCLLANPQTVAQARLASAVQQGTLSTRGLYLSKMRRSHET